MDEEGKEGGQGGQGSRGTTSGRDKKRRATSNEQLTAGIGAIDLISANVLHLYSLNAGNPK